MPDRIARGFSILSAAFFFLGGLALIWMRDVGGVRALAANLLLTYLLGWTVALLFSRLPPRELHLRFALTTLALGLAAVSLEALALANLVDYRKAFGAKPPEYWLHPENRFDEELLSIRRPHLEISGTTEGHHKWCLPADLTIRYPYRLRYDHNGFRNATDVSAARVVVLGDSQIEAVRVSDGQTLTDRLAALDGQPVANLGQTAYGPQQELSVLRRFALPLDPEVIVWAFYEGNDLLDIGSFELTAAQLSRGLLRIEATSRDRSFAKNALHALYRQIHSCETWPGLDRRVGVFTTAEGDRVRVLFSDLFEPLGRPELAAVDRFGDILAEVNELAARNEGRLVFLFIPTKQRVYGNLVELPLHSSLWDSVDNDLPALLEAVVRERAPGMPFVDLTTAFRSEAAAGRLLYFPDDTHLNPEGHRVAAKTLWPFISNLEPVAP